MSSNTPNFKDIEAALKDIALRNQSIDNNLSGVEASIEDTSLNNITKMLKQAAQVKGQTKGVDFGMRKQFGELGSRPELVKRLLKQKFGEDNVIEAGGTIQYRASPDEPYRPANKAGLDLGDVGEFLPAASRFGTTLGAEVGGAITGALGGPIGAVAGGIAGAGAGEALNERNILAKARKEGLLTPQEEEEALSRIIGAGAGGGAMAAVGGAAGGVLSKLGGPIVAKLAKTPAGKKVIKSLQEAREKTVGGFLERFGSRGTGLTKQKGQVGEAVITKQLADEGKSVEPTQFGEIISQNVGNFVNKVNQESSVLLNNVRNKVLDDAQLGKANFADASDLIKGIDKELDVLKSQGAFSSFDNLSAQQLKDFLEDSLNNVNRTYLGGDLFDPTKVTASDLLNTRVALQNQIKKFGNKASQSYNPQVSSFFIGVKKAIDESVDDSLKILGNTLDDEIVDDSLESVGRIGSVEIPKNAPEFAQFRKGLKKRADAFKTIDSKTRELTYKNKSGELLSPEKVTQNFDSVNFDRQKAKQVRHVILKENPEAFPQLGKAFRQKQLLKAEKGEKGAIRSDISEKAKRSAGLLEDVELSGAQKTGIDPSEGINEIKRLAGESDKSIRRDPSFRAGSVVDQTKRIAPKAEALMGAEYSQSMKPLNELADFQAAQDKNLTTRGLFDVVEQSVKPVPLVGPLLSGLLSSGEGALRYGARFVKPATKVPLAPTQNLIRGLLGQTQAGEEEEQRRR